MISARLTYDGGHSSHRYLYLFRHQLALLYGAEIVEKKP
jgi:hypothetical protein